jgi:hypothetical protein
MASKLTIALAVTFALIFSSNVFTARAQQKPLTSDQRQVIDAVSTIFTAARADDVAKFNSFIASGFYIFDVGARFNGDSVMALIKAQHAAGKRYEWNVTEPDVHISGNTPWIAYVNKGSISSLTTASSETLDPSPRLMDSRRRHLHPRKSA